MWYIYFRRLVLAVFALFAGVVLALSLVAWNTFPVRANAQREGLSFPFQIEGTDLIAEGFVSYEGDYFEDKSEVFIVDGAALCVYNRGDKHIDFVSVYIETADGVYCFEGTCIPSHTKVMILEKYKSLYPHGTVCLAAGRTVISNRENIIERLRISPVDMGKVEVRNISDTAMCDINLYYKQYDSSWDTLIGGITYVVSAGDLKAGESVLLFPANYVNGYSKILYATAK